MPRQVAFIVNRQAGGGAHRAWIDSNRDAIERVAAGGAVSMVENGAQIGSAVASALASGCNAVVAAGGDGTLNAVASQLVGHAVDFGVLPFGTLNHFAKDVGVALDPAEALQSIADGHTTRVDIGEVNGQYFLNNSSIGLYVDLVRDRDRQQMRLGRGKWPAFAWAFVGSLRRYPFTTVKLTLNGQARVHRTPFVFVGNNAYLTEGLQIGQRAGLTDGALSVYVAERAGRWRLFCLGLRALSGRLRQAEDFRVFAAPEVRIDSRHRQLRVAVDGELRRIETPLVYRTHPGALRVIVPARVATQRP